MYGAHVRNGWMLLATATLVFFVGVMVLHPFAPHEHDVDHFENTTLATLHTGVVERSGGFVPIVLMLSFSLVLAEPRARLIRALTQRGTQDVDIPILLPLRSAFRGGILNPKSY